MRFYTCMQDNRELPAVSFDGGRTGLFLCDLGIDAPDMNVVIEMASEDWKNDLADRGRKNEVLSFSLETAKLCAPIPRPKQDMICLGINYNEHAKEAGSFSEEAFGGERPYTIYFSKRVSRALDPDGIIPSYPGLVDSLDYECELGVILGRDVFRADEQTARDSIFGYTIVNDVSARNLQTRHKQWYLGKSLDGFTPIGPCIVTPEELGDAENLGIRCFVNGQPRQNSNTRYMIQTVTGAVCELSAGMTLMSGTIIATGTPAGVGMGMKPPCFLKSGDVVTCEIEGIGRLENTVGD